MSASAAGTARLGLGTYRVQPGAIPAAVARASADPGTAWVDTAPNYLHGNAQKLIAPALPGRTIAVSTKTGFLSPAAARDALKQGVLPPDAVRAGYSLDPGYIRWQCARNRDELGVSKLGVVFAHNPEHLGDNAEGAMRNAIAALEEETRDGLIGCYGIATWAGFDTGKLTVSDLDRQAVDVTGPGHHLRAIQLPVSLVTASAFSQALDQTGPVSEASARGWEVFASAPLHGGELPRLATRELADLLDPGLTVAQVCLLAVASCPGVSRVLLSASSPRHWNDAREALARPPLPVPVLRKVLDVLTAG